MARYRCRSCGWSGRSVSDAGLIDCRGCMGHARKVGTREIERVDTPHIRKLRRETPCWSEERGWYMPQSKVDFGWDREGE